MSRRISIRVLVRVLVRIPGPFLSVFVRMSRRLFAHPGARPGACVLFASRVSRTRPVRVPYASRTRPGLHPNQKRKKKLQYSTARFYLAPPTHLSTTAHHPLLCCWPHHRHPQPEGALR